MQDHRSDSELVAAVNGGDWSAFDILYYRHRDWAYRLAWRFCGEPNDAHDVVQEVFIYLAGKFRAGLELRAGLTTLLYPAIKHTALAIKKRRRLGNAPDDSLEAAPTISPTDPPARAELAAALMTLTPAHREILLMRFVDDLSLEEIATVLAIPLGTVKSRLHHAIEALREDARARRFFQP